MAGAFTHPLGRASRRARRAAALLALALGLCLLLLGAESPSAARAAKVAQGTCPAQPAGFAPPNTFTMLIRINTQGNVDTYTKPGGGMGSRIQPQDIFVLNTRFSGSANFAPMTPTIAAQLSANLRAVFPCNRIIDLNGLSLDPAQPGYAFTGIDDPNTYALLADLEQTDWNSGRALDPTRPPFSNKFAAMFPLIKAWDLAMAANVAANPLGANKRTGLAPQSNVDTGDWNYGQIAQDLDLQNSRLGPKLGPMVVQTQDSCSTGQFGPRAKQLRLQYNFRFITKKVKKRVKVKGKVKIKKVKKITRKPLKEAGKPLLGNMAMELSFSENPDPTSNMAVVRTSAAQVAACIPPAVKQGVDSFFFFASDDAMRQLFQQPSIAAARPPTGTAATGTAAPTTPSGPSGGVGSPG
jgi:hypothetical protein